MNQLTRNPNLDLQTGNSSNLTQEPEITTADSLVGSRPDWWWTGKPPILGKCPGVWKNGKIYSLPLPDLSKCTRQQVRDYFDNTWTLTEVLFSSLQGADTFYLPPYHQLRHPLVFYYCHPAALYINKLRVAGILKTPINPYFEQLFETGVDEMSWDDMSKNDMEWPSLKEANDYRRQVYQIVEQIIETHPDFEQLPITQESPLWSIFMGFEHERIHLETSSVLIRELPVSRLRRPEQWPDNYPGLGPDYPENEMIAVPAGNATIGKPLNWPSYGWDNEYGSRQVRVSAFRASKYLITNGQFYEFVKAGGYHQEKYWTKEGWSWRVFRNVKYPTFWVASGPIGSHQYNLRTCFEVVQMPWSWPAIVNYHEAKAYCTWRSEKEGLSISYRLITEAEHQRMRDYSCLDETAGIERDAVMKFSGHDLMETKQGNYNLAYSSESPVDAMSPNSKGFCDVFGNVWQWCEDHFYPLSGFKIHPLYDDFSTPCFDGKHNMILGGSFISTGDEASIWARFHFRPHFFQHAGFRLVWSEDEDSQGAMVNLSQQNNTGDVYETPQMLNEYMLLHYGSVKETISFEFGPLEALNFPERCAQLVIQWAKQLESKTERALDLGCSVGRATFEMTRSFQQVIGLDLSSSFIKAANHLKEQGNFTYFCKDEGELGRQLTAKISEEIERERVSFRQADACAVPPELKGFDAVLLANLICRLPSPKACLARMGGTRGLVRPGGLLVITSPYTWMEEFTPKEVWLGGYKKDNLPIYSLDGLVSLLGDEFKLIHQEDMPLLIREHSRKYQYIVAHTTVWQRLS